ncbi:MAG: anthranilate synthase component I [Cyanobacteria bacterium J083]|nr:MAG: anthranilate synthase component I [Cyanobacteria bacterium J083]
MSSHLKPWHWRSQPLADRSPTEIFSTLFLKPGKIATLLQSPTNNPDLSKLCRYSICAGEPRIVAGKARIWTPKLGNILDCLSNFATQPQTQSDIPAHLPFVGGWLGWLGYDLAWEIEQLPRKNSDNLPFPVAYWYEPANFAVIDHLEQTLWLASSQAEQLDILSKKLINYRENEPKSPIKPLLLPEINFESDRYSYEQSVKRAKEYIRAGDIFQANLSLRFNTTSKYDSWSIYRRLQQINPSPFASYWQTPWGELVSCSPERLVKLEKNRAETRPIAGTRPRGRNLLEEQKLAAELLTNDKERAEHIMLVDLARNDLGKVCQWGSVEVDELLTIERYSHVMHLVSNVRGVLPADCHAVDLIAAMFPGGTITGCPKVRCLEIIEELEPVSRSLFYGSCGYLDYRGKLDLNILIRTLLCSSVSGINQVWGQVGAGIVADSEPTKEWFESWQKAKAQLTALKN